MGEFTHFTVKQHGPFHANIMEPVGKDAAVVVFQLIPGTGVSKDPCRGIPVGLTLCRV